MRAFFQTSLTVFGVTLGALSSPDVFADLDVYKCKDAQGRLNYTDSPCVGSSKMISYSKVTEHHYQYAQQKAAQVKQFKEERVAVARRNSALRSNVNVFAVNEKYDNQVFDEKFRHPRMAEQGILNKNLEKIEAKRQRELKGR